MIDIIDVIGSIKIVAKLESNKITPIDTQIFLKRFIVVDIDTSIAKKCQTQSNLKYWTL